MGVPRTRYKYAKRGLDINCAADLRFCPGNYHSVVVRCYNVRVRYALSGTDSDSEENDHDD
eukprot:407311-Rhodomonas_salina.2